MTTKYEPKDKSQFITFYSYKGGVGRTMALANVACQMAIRHGKHVVCIDWDLEAPGLHYYFGYTDEELAGRKGLLDYMIDFRWQLTQGAKGKVPRVTNYLVDLKGDHESKITAGSVRFMHCGATDANYSARVQEFDWDAFYKESDGFRVIETLKKQLLDEAKADMVLVDARAGQAEVGTTPTIQMPDAVVLLFTSNRQSIEGTERIARDLYHHPLRKQIGAPPKILLVPSRVFPREESYKDWEREQAEPVFKSLVERKIVSRVDQPHGLQQCAIPVDQKWATGERLPILEAEHEGAERGSHTLPGAYITLAQELDNLHEGRGAWDIEPEFPDARAPSEVDDEIRDLRLSISDAVVRGDEAAVALAQFELARASINRDRFDEAETLIASSEAYAQRVKNERGIRRIMYLSGFLKYERGAYDESLVLLRKALALSRTGGDKHDEGVALHQMGHVRLAQKDYDDALVFFEQSWKLIEESGDVGEQAFIRHSMGAVRFAKREYGIAWTLLEKSLDGNEETGDQHGQSASLHGMAGVRFAQGRFSEAKELGDRALLLANAAKAEDGISKCKALIEACELAMAEGRGDQTASVTAKGELQKVKGKKARPAKAKSKKSRKS